MASTVTFTTVNSMAAIGLDTSLSIFCAIFLSGLLVLKEMLSTTEGARKKFIVRSLNLGIIPLLLSFTAIVALNVVEILS
jgi:hypothetical protein